MAVTLDICAPADQTEGTRSQVLRWLKAVGDTVTEHEPLIELETDKVTVEVPAPASGVLREIFKAEQDEIAPGDVLGRIEAAGASDARAAAAPPERVAFRAATEGSLASPSKTAVSRTASSASQALSPAVQRLLAERGLDPSQIRGTGADGRITVDDIAAHDAANDAAAAVASAQPPVSAKLARRSSATLEDGAHGAEATGSVAKGVSGAHDTAPSAGAARSVPHSAIRKRTAEHMVQSLQTAPHVTTVFEADLSAVMAHRSAHGDEFQRRGAPLTFTAYFLAATVDAIRAVPEANSRWSDSALEIYENIHVGVATAVEGIGLVVPVVRNVESLDLFGIASGLARLVASARSGRLEPADVRGGTFTLSNHGVSGSLVASPIVIHQPQSAILGIGKLEKRAVVVEQGDEEKIVVRPRCYVTLTIDHRVMDGHQANRFLQTFVRKLDAWPRDA